MLRKAAGEEVADEDASGAEDRGRKENPVTGWLYTPPRNPSREFMAMMGNADIWGIQ